MGGGAEHREASCRTRALPPQVPQQGRSTVLSRHSQHPGPHWECSRSIFLQVGGVEDLSID